MSAPEKAKAQKIQALPAPVQELLAGQPKKLGDHRYVMNLSATTQKRYTAASAAKSDAARPLFITGIGPACAKVSARLAVPSARAARHRPLIRRPAIAPVPNASTNSITTSSVILAVNASRANNDSKQGHRYQGRPQQKPECESADDSYLQSRLSSKFIERPANGKPRDDTEGNSAEELRPDRDNDGCVYGPE